MRVLPAPAGVLLCLALAAGCASQDDEPQGAPAGESPAAETTSSSDPASPTTSATATEPEPTPSPSGAAGVLLATDEVPGLNESWHWQDGESGPADQKPFGLCAKVDLASIGATEVVQRTWFPPDDSDDNAAQQVATFPDTTTASQAWAVLKAWHDKCGRNVSADIGLRVRPFVPVPVETGRGRWYLLSWSPPGEETGRFEAFGAVLSGTRIAVLRIDNSGQDYNYPPGEEPMVGMVEAAAARLG